MKNQVIVFDLDDTLLIQEEVARETIIDLAQGWGLDQEKARNFQQFFHKQCWEIWKDYPFYPYARDIGISAGEGLWGHFTGEAPDLPLMHRLVPEFRRRAWGTALERFGLADLEPQTVADTFEDLRRERQILFPRTREILEDLKQDYQIAMLTNGAPDLQWFKIHNSGIEDLFDSITVSGDHGIGKPKAGIFDVVRSQHPGATGFLMVGNSLSSDIQGAVNAGMPCVWVDRGEEAPRENLKPTAVIRELDELKALIPTLLD